MGVDPGPSLMGVDPGLLSMGVDPGRYSMYSTSVTQLSI